MMIDLFIQIVPHATSAASKSCRVSYDASSRLGNQSTPQGWTQLRPSSSIIRPIRALKGHHMKKGFYSLCIRPFHI